MSNVAACHFNPQTLRCPGGADTGNTCLSDEQINALTVYDTPTAFGTTLGSGETGYPGFNIYSGTDTRGLLYLNTAPPAPGLSPPLEADLLNLPYMYNFWDGWVKYFVTRDSTFNSLSLDPQNLGPWQARVDYLAALQDINNTDLSAFAKKGGKLIIVHGLADGLVSSNATAKYYDRVVSRFGADGARTFVRYYEIPGMAHGGAGAFASVWDSLSALENWVERGVAPTGQIISDKNAVTAGRTRPLCEYPSWPKYKGTGDINLASSFQCS